MSRFSRRSLTFSFSKNVVWISYRSFRATGHILTVTWKMKVGII
jgi:hypothetical protein